jgi:hypothetical protein
MLPKDKYLRKCNARPKENDNAVGASVFETAFCVWFIIDNEAKSRHNFRRF